MCVCVCVFCSPPCERTIGGERGQVHIYYFIANVILRKSFRIQGNSLRIKEPSCLSSEVKGDKFERIVKSMNINEILYSLNQVNKQ